MPAERKEWLQPPTTILVRQRERLGRSYVVLRPLAIVYASLFYGLRAPLVPVVYLGWWAVWIVVKGFLLLLDLLVVRPLVWIFLAFARWRWGSKAVDELRQSLAEGEAGGRAWWERRRARMAARRDG